MKTYLEKLKSVIISIKVKAYNTFFFKNIEKNFVNLYKDVLKKVKHEDLRSETLCFLVAALVSIAEIHVGFINNEIAQNFDLIEIYDCYLHDIQTMQNLTNNQRHSCVFLLCFYSLKYLKCLDKTSRDNEVSKRERLRKSFNNFFVPKEFH